MILVQKFGGTSVSTPERRIQVVEKIAQAKKEGFDPVVVISALGRRGEPYATDTLIGLARQECPDIGSRELDLIMSCGEIVAGVIVVAALKQSGLDAVLLNGQQAGIVTTARHGDAQILQVKPANIYRHVNEGRIVVVAGFQGECGSGEITTLGRGGSDTTAAALGAALGSNSVEIYTDVNGVKTIDPRVIPDAQTIPAISYEEMYQLAVHGAKVVHPRAVAVARHHNIPLRVKSTFTNERGTLICNEKNIIERVKGPAFVTGIAHRPDYALLKLPAKAPADLIENLLETLYDANDYTDDLFLSPDGMSLAGDSQLVEMLGRLAADSGVKGIEAVKDCAQITLVGSTAANTPAMTRCFVRLMRENRTNVLQVAAKQYAVAGVVCGEQLEQALNFLYNYCFNNAEGCK